MAAETCTDNLAICILSIVMISLIWLLVLPFMIFVTYRFYHIRHHPGISSRYPMIVLSLSIFNTLHIFIRDQYLLISSGIIPNILSSDPFIIWIINIIFPPFLLIIPITTLFRIWLINYDIKYTLANTRHDWQLLLSSTVNKNDNWYSRNKLTYGNWKWLIKIFIFIWILLSICEIIPTLFEYKFNNIFNTNSSHTITQLIYCLILSIIIIPIIILWIKIPNFGEDTFGIKKEIKLLLKFDFLCGLIWISMIYFSELNNIFEIIQIIIIIFFNFIQVFISEYWVIKKQLKLNQTNHRIQHYKSNYNNNNNDNNTNNNKTVMFFKNIVANIGVNIGVYASNDSYRRNTTRARSQTVVTNTRIFNILIAHNDGIEYLFQHLRKDFTIENLLFFIEIIQWIYIVTNREFSKYNILPINFELASIIPISSINNCIDYSSAGCNDNNLIWYYRMHDIYTKYISQSAEYQINLPYEIQMEYYNLFRLYDIKMKIDAGTYKPKLKKRIRHKRNTNNTVTSFFKSRSNRSNRWTFRKNKSVNNDNDPIPPPSTTLTPNRSQTLRADYYSSKTKKKNINKNVIKVYNENNENINKNDNNKDNDNGLVKRSSTEPISMVSAINIELSSVIPEDTTITPTTGNKTAPGPGVHSGNATVDFTLALSTITENKDKKKNTDNSVPKLQQKANKSDGDIVHVDTGYDNSLTKQENDDLYAKHLYKISKSYTKTSSSLKDKLISPKSIALTLSKSFSPKSLNARISHGDNNNTKLPDTPLIMERQSTFVEHQSVNSNSNEDDTDDDTDTDMSKSIDDVIKHKITIEEFNDGGLIVIDEDDEVGATVAVAAANKKDDVISNASSTMISHAATVSKDTKTMNGIWNGLVDAIIEEKEKQNGITHPHPHPHPHAHAIDIKATSMDAMSSTGSIYLSTTSITNPHPKKRSSLIVSGISKGLHRLSSFINNSGTSSMNRAISDIIAEEKENEIDEDEKKQMDHAKSLKIDNFINISYRAMYEILKLNYQSVARFKKTKQFKRWEETVNLKELLVQYSDKGCSKPNYSIYK